MKQLSRKQRPAAHYVFDGTPDAFLHWLKNWTEQGMWVSALGENQYYICEPQEWSCDTCGRWVSDAPICDHNNALSEKKERLAQYFNVLLWDVENVGDFERECEADSFGR